MVGLGEFLYLRYWNTFKFILVHHLCSQGVHVTGAFKELTNHGSVIGH